MKLFKSYYPILLLLLISLILCMKNYTPNTFLSGWDTLHPEFNFGLNFSRVFFGVFRTEQGLGAVAGHSHMSDLPRILLLYIEHFFLPLAFLRYSYMFLTLIVGPIGMYFFLYKCVLPHPFSLSLRERDRVRVSAFLGALCYLLNVGTMQTFIVPFEMFNTQYALLPWIFLFATEYLVSNQESRIKNQERKYHSVIGNSSLLFFSIATILASPMAYAATLWYVQFLVFLVYIVGLSFFLERKNWKLEIVHSKGSPGGRNWKFIKKPFILILLTLLLNLYWILPNIYFIIHHGTEVTHANINTLFSDEAFLHNKTFGNLQSIALMKTFLFDWNVYTGNNTFSHLLTPWINYLRNPWIMRLGYFFTICSLFGVVYGVIKKQAILLAITGPLLICLFFLFNDNFPQGPVYIFFQNYIPFFKEALRFPDDKILVLFIFVFSIYFAAAQELFFTIVQKFQKQNSKHEMNAKIVITFIIYTYSFIIAIFLITYMLPAFQGQLISPSMRIKIPTEYFAMSAWFNQQSDSGRVATLPIQSLWGWVYYDWYHDTQPSYQGAGFIWFGMKQPVLDRDFDRWSPYNEQYYREMSYAVYAQRPDLLEQVVKKYDIHYLLLDTDIISPQIDRKVLYFAQLKNILAREKDITQVATFSNHLFIYHVLTNDNHKAISVYQGTFPHINVPAISNNDTAYYTYGNYIQDNSAIRTYPLQFILNHQQKIIAPTITTTDSGISLTLPQKTVISPQNLTRYTQQEETIPTIITASIQNNNLEILFTSQVLSRQLRKIIAQTPLQPTDTSIVVSINDSTYTIPIQKTTSSISIGTINLATKTNTIIHFYHNTDQTSPAQITQNTISILPCNKSQPNQLFGISQRSIDSFSLFMNNAELCTFIPISQFITKVSQPNLLHLRFTYTGSLPSYVCLVKKLTDTCVDTTTKKIDPLATIDNLWDISTPDAQNGFIKLYVNAQNLQNQSVSYTNFAVRQIQSFATLTLSPTLITTALQTNSSINADMLTFPYSVSDPFIFSSQRKNDCQNNSIAANLPNEHASIVKTNTNQVIEYASSEGTFCDHFSYTNLVHNQAYIIGITSKNITGLPLHLCIANDYSNHCDVTGILHQGNNLFSEYFLLPALLDNASGYDIDISNIGITGTPAKNDLASIHIIPIPYNWLSAIQTSTTEPTARQLSTASQPINQTLYFTSIPAAPNKQTIVLSESFESGWKAYIFPHHPSWIEQSLPFFFGKEVTHHVMVNSWENGWEMNQNNLGNQTLVIIFEPQYLEYIGFFTMIVTVIIILYLKFIFLRTMV